MHYSSTRGLCNGLIITGALVMAGVAGAGIYRIAKGRPLTEETFAYPALLAASVGMAMYQVGRAKLECTPRE